jgi:hypothetical protein
MSFPTDEPLLDEYMCALDLPTGWVNITLESPSPVEAEEVAQEIVEQFNPLELARGKNSLVKEIADLALAAKKSRSSYTAACYTAAGGNIANVEVDVYGEKGVRVTPEDVQPVLLEKKNSKVFGEPDVTYLNLPLGPAVRVRATFKVKRTLGFGRRLVETVMYAVCPPITNDVMVATMRWEALERSDELIEMADAMIPTLHIIPCDEDGNPTDPDDLK